MEWQFCRDLIGVKGLDCQALWKCPPPPELRIKIFFFWLFSFFFFCHIQYLHFRCRSGFYLTVKWILYKSKYNFSKRAKKWKKMSVVQWRGSSIKYLKGPTRSVRKQRAWFRTWNRNSAQHVSTCHYRLSYHNTQLLIDLSETGNNIRYRNLKTGKGTHASNLAFAVAISNP